MPSEPQARADILALEPSRIREIANAGMGNPDVLPFWFGESDQPTPSFIRAAAVASLASEQTYYSQNLGLPELRGAIARYASGLHGRDIGAERIAVTSSGVSALMLATQSVVAPGGRVVVITPVWPNIVEIQRIVGAEVVRFPLSVSENRWTLDVEKLIGTLTPDTTMLVINSPSNPTGWVISPEDQQALLAHCRKLGIWILADEVYERLVYDGRANAASMLSIADPFDRLIVVNSFSKTWRMTGWRLGWLTLPPSLTSSVEKLIEYNTSCAPAFVQHGGIAALTDPRGEETARSASSELAASRNLLRARLGGLDGVELPEADGAMYAFFRIAGWPDSVALAKRLVTEVGLGLAPGSAFGPEGEGWLRWCFASSPGRIEQGIERLERFLALPA